MRTPIFAILLAALAAGLLPSLPARAADDEEEFGFELEEISPEEKARREQLRRELTEPRSFIELGTHYVSDDSYKFGDYTGLDNEGFSLLGNFDIRRRAPWDGDDTWHLRLRGANLGLDSRSFLAEFGHQGLFDVWGDFTEIPKFRSRDMWTPYRGIGSPLLTLPPDWVSSDTTAGFFTLDRNLAGRHVEHDRRRYGGGVSFQLPWDLEFRASYQGDEREGNKFTSAIIGSSGGNPRSAIVAEPIDYRTHEVDAKLRFNGERGQIEIGYYYSRFEDANEALTFENAFTLGSWDPSASFPRGVGSKSTPPDNFFHQITAAGGYSLPWWNTRITGDVAFGWMRQNESFLPFTANPTLAASITQDVPRPNLDGRMDTTAANVRIDSRPLPRLRLNGRFRYDDRENDTPRDTYIYIPGDAQVQGTLFSSTARINHPYSYRLKEYSAEAGYEILRRTELSLGFEYEEIQRSHSEVRTTEEEIYSARLTSHPWPCLSLRFEGELAYRGRSTYRGSFPFMEGTTREHLSTIPQSDRFENNPNLRKFYFADRDRNRLRGSVTLMPVDWLTFGFAFDNLNDHYDDTEIGLLHARTSSYTFDVTLNPCERFTTHAFYTHEELRTRQLGHSFSGNNVELDLANITRRWRATDNDNVNTVGWGFDLNFLEGRLTFQGDAIYSRAEGDIRVDTALMPAVILPGTPTSFPTVKSDLFGASVSGRYRFDDHISARLGYTFERLNVDDWSVDQILPASLPRVLTTGQTTPDYQVHVVSLSLIYEFR